jgi:hypothetical protein
LRKRAGTFDFNGLNNGFLKGTRYIGSILIARVF